MSSSSSLSEDACQFISSRGLLKSCKIRSANPISSNPNDPEHLRIFISEQDKDNKNQLNYFYNQKLKEKTDQLLREKLIQAIREAKEKRIAFLADLKERLSNSQEIQDVYFEFLKEVEDRNKKPGLSMGGAF